MYYMCVHSTHIEHGQHSSTIQDIFTATIYHHRHSNHGATTNVKAVECFSCGLFCLDWTENTVLAELLRECARGPKVRTTDVSR